MTSGDIAIRLFMAALAHGIGDYVLQSTWMAREKVKRWMPAFAHGAMYVVPFFFLVFPPSGSILVALIALLVIGGTHVVLDRLGVARYVVWAKDQLLAPASWRRLWSECSETGYPPETPEYMARWLTIIADNVIHILINTLVIIWAVKS